MEIKVRWNLPSIRFLESKSIENGISQLTWFLISVSSHENDIKHHHHFYSIEDRN